MSFVIPKGIKWSVVDYKDLYKTMCEFKKRFMARRELGGSMTDKDLKRIYEYMGIPNLTVHQHFPLDSNSAWECVQEMDRKDDLELFYYNTHNLCDEATRLNHAQFQLWLMNPTIFWRYFSKWLELRDGK